MDELQALEVTEAAFRYYRRLARVRRYCRRHYPEPIPLSKVAAVAGLQDSYFSSFFHAKTGVCFRDWLRHMRIEAAIRRIERSEYSITRIALDVGFNDLRTFERAFERCTGMTPRQFKYKVRP